MRSGADRVNGMIHNRRRCGISSSHVRVTHVTCLRERLVRKTSFFAERNASDKIFKKSGTADYSSLSRRVVRVFD